MPSCQVTRCVAGVAADAVPDHAHVGVASGVSVASVVRRVADRLAAMMLVCLHAAANFLFAANPHVSLLQARFVPTTLVGWRGHEAGRPGSCSRCHMCVCCRQNLFLQYCQGCEAMRQVRQGCPEVISLPPRCVSAGEVRSRSTVRSSRPRDREAGKPRRSRSGGRSAVQHQGPQTLNVALPWETTPRQYIHSPQTPAEPAPLSSRQLASPARQHPQPLAHLSPQGHHNNNPYSRYSVCRRCLRSRWLIMLIVANMVTLYHT